MREKGSNYYSIFPYFLAKLAVEIPANVILPLLFIVINYVRRLLSFFLTFFLSHPAILFSSWLVLT